MTLYEALKAKLEFINCQASDSFLAVLFVELNIESEHELTQNNKSELDTLLYNIIPLILAKPNSVSEGDYSIKYDRDSLIEFYNFLCFKNGLPNAVLQNAIRDKSDVW
jgi:hypothetical protein